MSDHPTLAFVIGLLVLLFAVWLFTGGPDRYESTAGKFIEPGTEEDFGRVYDEKLIDEGAVFTDFFGQEE